MCVCVCVCARNTKVSTQGTLCVYSYRLIINVLLEGVCVHVCVYAFVCICVSGNATHTHTHTHHRSLAWAVRAILVPLVSVSRCSPASLCVCVWGEGGVTPKLALPVLARTHTHTQFNTGFPSLARSAWHSIYNIKLREQPVTISTSSLCTHTHAQRYTHTHTRTHRERQRNARPLFFPIREQQLPFLLTHTHTLSRSLSLYPPLPPERGRVAANRERERESPI